MEPIRLICVYTPEDLSEMFKAAQKLGREKAIRGFRLNHSVIGWAIFIALAVVLFVFLERRRGVGPPPPSPWPALLSVWPWVLVFLVIWFFVFRQLRNAGKTMWDANPGLQQPQTITIADDGVTIEAPSAQTRTQWTAYVGWLETKNLLLLREPGTTFLMIPKRAATEEQLARLRETFARHVVEPAGGFPVLPASGER